MKRLNLSITVLILFNLSLQSQNLDSLYNALDLVQPINQKIDLYQKITEIKIEQQSYREATR